MKIYPIKAFSDNYIWMLEKNNEAIVVDPGESPQVLAYLEENNLTLRAILLTHNHDDHTGGVMDMSEKYPDIAIYGPVETEELNTRTVSEGDTVEVLDESFEVFLTAGHTEAHISYLSGSNLFCGDALFSGGCGRVFTGDYQAQYDALQKFRKLDDTVNVYAAHEYTITNLSFALTIEPGNAAIQKALDDAKKNVMLDKSTLPSSIALEKEINILLRSNTLKEFVFLRQKRDQF